MIDKNLFNTLKLNVDEATNTWTSLSNNIRTYNGFAHYNKWDKMWDLIEEYLPDESKNTPLDQINENKENETMNLNFGGMFDGMFKPVARSMCKIGMDGQIAIRTNSGYKTFDIKKHKLVNCDNFAFDMDGMFWVVPTFKVDIGDIILVNGKPRAVIEIGANSIKTFSYENSTIDEIVPEYHVFMGKTYCYGKIFSPFTGMGKDNGELMTSMMNMMMMSQMFGNGDNNNMGFNPMMFMFLNNNGNNPFMNMFEGAFNFGAPEENESKKED